MNATTTRCYWRDDCKNAATGYRAGLTPGSTYAVCDEHATPTYRTRTWTCADGSTVKYNWDGRGPWYSVDFNVPHLGLRHNHAYGQDQRKAWAAVKTFIDQHGGLA